MSEKGRNIILKLGSRTIECGLEGSYQPLDVYNVHHFAEIQDLSISTTKEQIDDLKNFKTLFYPNKTIYNDEESFQNILRNHLRKLLTKIFYKLGLSTINAKLLLISNNTTSEYYIELISQLLINHFLMRAIIVLSTPLMVSIASGSSSATIVDFGWEYINIDVVSDNRVLQNYSKFTIRGGKCLHYELLNRMKSLKFNTDLVSFKDIENAISSVKNTRNVDETIDCGPYKITKKFILETITELMVQDNGKFDDDDEKSPVQLIMELVERQLPIDLRMILADRIIFTGSLFKIEGIEQIITENLNSKSRFTFKTIHSLGSFAGTSLYSNFSKQLRKNQKLWEYRK